MNKRRGDTRKGRAQKANSPRVSASSLTPPPLITLLTDFGNADYFVGAVKGVILGLSPNAQIVDITHEIPPQDIEAAAFTLLAAHSSFPAGTIHLAVVDPGVGSARRPIVIQAREQFFVGPDNGIFSYVCEHTSVEVFHLTNQNYFRPRVSTTFHGRDIFAPVAAALANGVKPSELGERITDLVRLPQLSPVTNRDGSVNGRIIHIDRFGNCITNITPADLPGQDQRVVIRVRGQTIKAFRKFFAEEIKSREPLFGIWGSAGFLEIAATNKSAAKILKAKRGDPVVVIKTVESRRSKVESRKSKDLN